MVGERPIRVAMLHGPGRPEHDGVSDYVSHLVEALDSVRVKAIAIPIRPGGERTSWRWLAATDQAARQVRRLQPDLVHVQFAPSAYGFSGLPGLLPLRLPRRLPLLTTVHEYGDWATPGWLPLVLWRPLELAGWWDRETGRLVPASTVAIVSNSTHAQAVRQRTGVPAVRVPIPPNVPEARGEPRPRQHLRAEFGVAPDAPLLVFFGFVHPVKGVRYLIEALPALRCEHPDVRLLVVGGFTSQALPKGSARAFHGELSALAHQHGVAEAVTFTGHISAERVSAALHAADLAVLPFTAGVTLKSGALLAALAHGVPVAATLPDDGGDAELCEAIGVIPARRNAAAIATTVGRLLDDAGLRRRLAERGRRAAEQRSWPAVVTAHRRLYELVLGGGHG